MTEIRAIFAVKAEPGKADNEQQVRELLTGYLPRMEEEMGRVATLVPDSLVLEDVTDSATVDFGNPREPYLLTLWQHNMVAGLFIAESESTSLPPGDRHSNLPALGREHHETFVVWVLSDDDPVRATVYPGK